MSFAASFILKWHTSKEKRTLLLIHCHGVLIWLLQLSVLMTRRVQPVCCSGYVLLNSGPWVLSGILLWKKHALEMADLLCMMVWLDALYMVTK